MKYIKKYLIYLLALLLVFTMPVSSVGASIVKGSLNQTNHITMTYSFDDPIIGEKDSLGYQTITVKDLAKMATPGNPILPFKPVKLLIPKGKIIENINVTFGQQKTLDNVKVSPAASVDTIGVNYSYSQPDMPIYQSDSSYPDSNYSKPLTQWKAAYQLQFLNLYPVHFIPKQQRITFTNSIKVDITLSDSATLSSPNHSRPIALDRQSVSHLIDNPDALKSYDSDEESVSSLVNKQTIDTPATPLLNGKTDYVIITTKDFVKDFTPLIDWKISKGLSAAIVTVEDIYSKYPGTDSQEQIRSFIKDANSINQTKFVLLGGDADGENIGDVSGDVIVPVRNLCAFDGYAAIPSDLYYSCLDGDFDANKNGIYGEAADVVDFFAEVSVGRAPVDSSAEVKNFVNKTVLYEKSSKEPTAWMLGEKLSADDPNCSVEMAAKEQQTLSPNQIIDTLRELRDKTINPDYVNFYYQNNTFFKQAFVNSPLLLVSFTKLLVKFTPEFSGYLAGKSGESMLTKEDVANILDFSQLLMDEVKKQTIPAENLDAIVAQLTELQTYTKTLVEKSTYDALAKSPYISKNAGNALSGETWGGDYKDEIKNGSTTEFTTGGIPASYTVSTLYDRDYSGNNWPKSEVIDTVLNPGPNLINHMGHANNTILLKLENSDVDALTNTSPFFLYSQGCYAGSFDNRDSEGNYTNQDSIAEHFVCATNGAFATIVNSRYGWYTKNKTTAPSQYFDRQFWDGVFGQKIHSLGRALSYSKEMNFSYLSDSDYADHMRYCYYEINLLGDPETKLTETEKGNTLPVIVSSDPTSDSENVAVNKTMIVKFNKDVIIGDNFSEINLLDASNLPVSADITLSGNAITINPTTDLTKDITYTVNIPDRAVKDAEGNQLAQAFIFSFTTGTGSPEGPIIIDTNIDDSPIPLRPTINVIFDQDVVKDKAFKKITLKYGKGKSVKVSSILKADTLIIKPMVKLKPGTVYTLTIPPEAVKDETGISQVENFTYTFTTKK